MRRKVDQARDLEICARDALAPPSPVPCWQWCEENIVLDNTSAIAGRYSTDLVPMVRSFFNYAQHPRTRRLTAMVSAQSAKTQSAINFLLWTIPNDPATTFWVMGSADHCKEFAKKRLWPAVENCEATAPLLPEDRSARSEKLVQFDTMNLILRGSNSKLGLRSDPVRRIICDERGDWAKGAIDIVRKRTVTFHNAIEISMGTAGEEFDELHSDFNEGSRTFFFWPCRKCGFPQPFRFGRKASPLYPKERKRGGMLWETDATTKPGGEWDFKELAKTVRYECENCGETYRNHEKFALLKRLEEYHENPAALPSFVSMHWSALYMPWAACDWAEIVIQFLKATAALERHNFSPLVTFIQETLGEPWRVPSEKVNDADLKERRDGYRTGETYKLGDGQRSARILTVDVQNAYLVAVDREWREGGSSRLIRAMKLPGWEELRRYQVEQKIGGQCCFIDWPFKSKEVSENCLRYGWNPMLGDEAKDFVQEYLDATTGKKVGVRTPWKPVQFDPFIGTLEKQGQVTLRRFLWSNPHYLELLYFYAMKGLLGQWAIPFDIDTTSDDYVAQVMAYERLTIVDSEGRVSYQWTFRGRRHDFADCELMQLAAADICSITSTRTIPNPNPKDK